MQRIAGSTVRVVAAADGRIALGIRGALETPVDAVAEFAAFLAVGTTFSGVGITSDAALLGAVAGVAALRAPPALGIRRAVVQQANVGTTVTAIGIGIAHVAIGRGAEGSRAARRIASTRTRCKQRRQQAQ
jgi:hypothetical protein